MKRPLEEIVDEAMMITPSYFQGYVRPAFEGVAGAAADLAIKLDHKPRALLMHLLYEARIPPAELREALVLAMAKAEFWQMIDEFDGGSGGPAEMFRYAEFPIPGDLPETLKVYIGWKNVPVREVVPGLLWTLDRDVAAHQACLLLAPGDIPYVAEATVPRNEIVAFYDEQGAREVVLANIPDRKVLRTDCNTVGLREAAERHQAKINSANERIRNELSREYKKRAR